MVLLLQVVQTVQACVDMIQFSGVEVGVLQQRAYLVGDVFQLNVAAVQAFSQLG